MQLEVEGVSKQRKLPTGAKRRINDLLDAKAPIDEHPRIKRDRQIFPILGCCFFFRSPQHTFLMLTKRMVSLLALLLYLMKYINSPLSLGIPSWFGSLPPTPNPHPHLATTTIN